MNHLAAGEKYTKKRLCLKEMKTNEIITLFLWLEK